MHDTSSADTVSSTQVDRGGDHNVQKTAHDHGGWVARARTDIAGPAAATHVHGKVLSNGECALLAPNGGEKYVQLPGTEDEYTENRKHPLHVNVHLAVPGTHAQPGKIFVAIGDDGAYTADAEALCDGEFIDGP